MQIYKLAVRIIVDFFEGEESDEEAAPPAANPHTNQFTFGSGFTAMMPVGGFSF